MCDLQSGIVYLVGAGPGDPDLLTLRALCYISAADLILYDYLVDGRVLSFARADAELVSLGEPYTGRKLKQVEVNERMIIAARDGRVVVRLKGGDPHIFGRLNEETNALIEAGIKYEVVPGITAASAAAQVAGISLTDRRNASAVALITGHLSYEHDPTLPAMDFKKFADFQGTLIFYMGVVTVRHWSVALLEGGMPTDTPVLIVQNATLINQKITRTTLINIEQKIKNENIKSPAIIIVGNT
ncbi:MAG: uroporphyrinogen-III C-methyltransferase [Planctomycetaceae bacterium]|jgi:uroporphyrinogen III methyltransferase/synthase|nr:uroporphyrinogen-III C-methyltransferase [Planctomycetaceae bacterium]